MPFASHFKPLPFGSPGPAGAASRRARAAPPALAAPAGPRAACLVVLAAILGCGAGPTASPPPDTAELAGVVLGEDGHPLAGATLTLGSDPPDRRVPMATARTGAAGEFRLQRVPAGPYRLVAERAGYVAAALHVEARSGAPLRVRLVLPPAVALQGIVEDARGAPVPLARVLVLSSEGVAGAIVPTAAADDAGRFRFGGLAAGPYRLLIEAPGLGTSTVPRVVAPDDAIKIVLPGESRFVRGTVTQEGRPVVGARVLLGGEALVEARRTDTDLQGRFVFGGLGAGSYALRADSGGLVSELVTDVSIDRGGRRTAEIDLPMKPGRFMSGIAVDDLGNPVAAAEIWIDTVPSWGMTEGLGTSTRGEWSSGALPSGRYRVEARHPGYLSRRAVTLVLGEPPHEPTAGRPARGARSAAAGAAPSASPSPQAPSVGAVGGAARRAPAAPGGAVAPSPWATVTRDVLVELVRTASLSGRLLDEGGAPVAGAEVNAAERRAGVVAVEELGVISTPLPLAAEAAALSSGSHRARDEVAGRAPARAAGPLPSSRGTSHPHAAASSQGPERGTSDAEGRFWLGGLTPGRVRLEVAAPGMVPLRTEPVELAPGQHRALADVRLGRAVMVSGKVVAEDGSPILGARVSASPTAPPSSAAATGLPGNEPPLPDFFALTDASGAFSLPLATGRYRLLATRFANSVATAVATAVVEVVPGRSAPPAVVLRLPTGPRAPSPSAPTEISRAP